MKYILHEIQYYFVLYNTAVRLAIWQG